MAKVLEQSRDTLETMEMIVTHNNFMKYLGVNGVHGPITRNDMLAVIAEFKQRMSKFYAEEEITEGVSAEEASEIETNNKLLKLLRTGMEHYCNYAHNAVMSSSFQDVSVCKFVSILKKFVSDSMDVQQSKLKRLGGQDNEVKAC